jgi:hypothetical protein
VLNPRPLDPACPIDPQWQSEAHAVVQVNMFTVAEADFAARMLVPNVCAA